MQTAPFPDGETKAQRREGLAWDPNTRESPSATQSRAPHLPTPDLCAQGPGISPSSMRRGPPYPAQPLHCTVGEPRQRAGTGGSGSPWGARRLPRGPATSWGPGLSGLSGSLQRRSMPVLPSDSQTVSHGSPRGRRAQAPKGSALTASESARGAQSGAWHVGLRDEGRGAGTSRPQQQSRPRPRSQRRGSWGQALGPAPALSSLPRLTQVRHPLAQSLSFPTSLYVPPLCSRLWVAVSQ